MAEVIKSDRAALLDFMQRLGYETITEDMGLNMLAIHTSDPSRQGLRKVAG
jgi:hypothetical protein